MAKKIHIKVNGRVADNDCRKTLSISGSEKVKWTANDDGGPWKVVFANGTPFFDATGNPVREFRVRRGASSPVSPRASDPPHVLYKYEVWENWGGGARTDDPDILVDD